MENLKEIIGFDGLYKIDEYGNVYNRKMQKLKQHKCSSGTTYYQVCLCKQGKAKNYLTHRLVAKHFIENPLNKEFVNHKDGNKTNNHVSNLEWVSRSENGLHSIHVLGNPKPPSWKGKTGALHNKSKKIIDKETNIVYGSISEAGRLLNIPPSTVHYNMNKRFLYL
jgi:hypothetical protein